MATEPTRQLDASQATAATSSATAQPPPDDEALARILAARGIPPEEIGRLLALGQCTARAAPPSVGSATPNDLDVQPRFVPSPTLRFPDFSEVTAEDATVAEGLLREANLARRRGRFAEAQDKCLAAIQRTPKDAAALELLGDILQAVGRVDDAIAAYHRAGEADPKRRSAERKYAELMLLQDRASAALQGMPVHRNAYLAVLLSAVCPGAGQYYNGETVKALTLALIALVLIALLAWTPLGIPGGASSTAVALIGALGVLYVVALIDANIGARSDRSRKSGWDV